MGWFGNLLTNIIPGAELVNDWAMQNDAQEHANEQQGRNFEFQKEMSNTQVQRAVADMEAAGINPLLAASHSAGGASGGTVGAGVVHSSAGQNYLGSQRLRLESNLNKELVATEATKQSVNNATVAKIEAETQAIERENRLSGKGYESSNKDPSWYRILNRFAPKSDVEFNSSKSKKSYGTTGRW